MHNRGYKPDEVNLEMSQKTHDKYFSDDWKQTELGINLQPVRVQDQQLKAL